MDPQSQFCHNPTCPNRGRGGRGNIRIHSQKEQRHRCSTCGQTFAATKGTPFYRLRGETDVVMLVLTLLCHGCPLQAIVVAFGFDERTVARWQARAGYHCQRVHEHLVSQGSVELGHVQADELWVKRVGRRVWMAMALAVPSSLGLGYARRRVVKVVQRVVRGTAEAIAVVLATTGGGTAINTAYIERLNATFRSALAPLVRRGRAIAHKEAVLTAGMCLVGCAYNFCWYHASLRLVAPEGTHRKWQERTPAMAAGLTNHRWAMRELLLLKIPWPAGVVPEQCRRPPKQKQQPLMAMAA